MNLYLKNLLIGILIIFGFSSVEAITPRSEIESMTYEIYRDNVLVSTQTNRIDFLLIPEGRYRIDVYAQERYTGYTSSTSFYYLIDKTPPSVDDLEFNYQPGAAFEATIAQSLGFQINDTGIAGIGEMHVAFEDFENKNETIEYTQTGGVFIQDMNISRVDDENDRVWGARPYTFDIQTICDVATNCLYDIPAIEYNVYANVGFSSGSVISHSLSNSDNIADGTEKNVMFVMRDVYGNDIVPAIDINRKIELQIQSNNSLAQNQYEYYRSEDKASYTGDSAVYVSSGSLYIPLTLGTGSVYDFTSISKFRPNAIDQYQLDVKVYSPTKNSITGGSTQWNGNLEITDMNVIVKSDALDSDEIATIRTDELNLSLLGVGNIEAIFKPIYSTHFDGSIKENGFIEGVTQTGTILVQSIQPANNFETSNKKAFLEFGSVIDGLIDSFEMKYATGTTLNTDTIVSTGGLNTVFKGDNNFLGYVDVQTNLSQTKQIESLESVYLSTHLRYDITDPNDVNQSIQITYNSNILGDYIGTILADIAYNTSQASLKVIGQIHSKKLNNTVSDVGYQLDTFGDISKSALKQEVHKNIHEAIIGIETSPMTADIILSQTKFDGDVWDESIFTSENKSLHQKSIVYFADGAGYNITLGNDPNDNSNIVVEGNKTVVVRGGNIYINDNMYYQNDDDILGIIALQEKDSDGNPLGGNIYIHPDVTNVVGTIFAEGSILSYDGGRVLDHTATQQELRNQLHIYGSLFSENTIGGASIRGDDSQYNCPIIVAEGACDKSTAQKYDLNYLRRYQRYDHDKDDNNNDGLKDDGTGIATISIPLNNGKVMGNTTCDNIIDPTRCGNDLNVFAPHHIGLLQDSPYKDYQVLIKYNFNMQLDPPPLFWK